MHLISYLKFPQRITPFISKFYYICKILILLDIITMFGWGYKLYEGKCYLHIVYILLYYVGFIYLKVIILDNVRFFYIIIIVFFYPMIIDIPLKKHESLDLEKNLEKNFNDLKKFFNDLINENNLKNHLIIIIKYIGNIFSPTTLKKLQNDEKNTFLMIKKFMLLIICIIIIMEFITRYRTYDIGYIEKQGNKLKVYINPKSDKYYVYGFWGNEKYKVLIKSDEILVYSKNKLLENVEIIKI